MAGSTLTHAASRFSTKARAIPSASAGEAQALKTTILSVIAFFFDPALDVSSKQDYKQM
jgi:hypothetical protein